MDGPVWFAKTGAKIPAEDAQQLCKRIGDSRTMAHALVLLAEAGVAGCLGFSYHPETMVGFI